MKTKRIFIGFPINKILTVKLLDFRLKLAQNILHSVDLKWVKDKNYHLTLLFIGSVKEDEITPIFSLVEKIHADVSDFNLITSQITTFPHRKPKMIWCEFQPSETFGKLVNIFKK